MSDIETNANNKLALGALLMLTGLVAVALMDAVAKIATADIPVIQIVSARFVFHFLIITPFVLFVVHGTRLSVGKGGIKWRTILLHALRGIFLAAHAGFFMLAIKDNPVPDALAVFYIQALIAMILARLFLAEPFSRRLLVAAVVGLVGVLIVLRPGLMTEYRWTMVFALMAAFSFASYIVATRYASFRTSAIVTSWLTAFFGALPLLPLAFFIWQPPDTRSWALMVAIGVLSGIGQTLVILACRYMSVAHVSVMLYAEIGIAAVISWILFSHVPGVWVWIGVALIIAANLYAVQRQP